MAKFEYKAKDGPGKTVTGVMDADTRDAVLASLDIRGLTPILVKEATAVGHKRSLGFGKRISFRDITLFTAQLASLFKSGVPILRALSIITEQTENSELRKVVAGIEMSVRDGKMLSVAFADYPEHFPDLYISMVRAGEASGVLDVILLQLAEAREKEDDVKRKLQAALAYPVLIVVVGLGTVFGLLTLFLPRVVELFRDYNDLPLPTKILMGLSNFFATNWYWILLVLLLFAAIIHRIATLDKGRLFFDTIKLRLPFFGRLITESEISRFARTFSLLIKAGMSIDRALEMSAHAVSNKVLRDDLEMVRTNTVEHGGTISSGLRRSVHFPAMVTNMAAVGEEGGTLDEAMDEVSVYYEKQCEQRGRLAVSLVEPIMILVVGALVGFIVAAMLMPIFELGTGI
ncbi:MAG: type II secretion system F family protein [Kiritimatiellae bacterium]|nr:type II secretion system F family protein [Kiritimatiellia bacterium]